MSSPVPLKVLQRQVKALRADLLAQSEQVETLRTLLREQYESAFAAKRTGATFESWRDEQLDQAAVAWVLGLVFVRFCEDNKLVDRVWIGGPGTVDAAVQAKTAYFMAQPTHNDRHWILDAFTHLRGFRATEALFDQHNPVWQFAISADAAEKLLEFWQRGDGLASFEGLDTRFLGDLYQDLSEDARKRYALLQTPEFVEEFILKLTLDESLKEYGLAETSVIDPTCGSGHFLLGAFRRLHKQWLIEAPAMDPGERVQKALNQVTGVDINPFAVAIARFRLLIEAMQVYGVKRLADTPGFTIRVAAGDSLLPWHSGSVVHQTDLIDSLQGREEYAYFTEDAALLADYLRPGQYTVAVGNPPYITVKDKTLNERYRELYDACSGLYSLSVPFAQRFFALVRRGDNTERAGFVGQITASSFMKREFGKKLIEQYFATHVELSHLIDTSGAYIPGHGTPTVILVGRRRFPRAVTVRAALGVLGEPTPPVDPADGVVWRAITDAIDSPGTANQFVSVVDLPRDSLSRYPWSMSGGQAGNVMASIEKSATPLRHHLSRVGFFGMTHADELFLVAERVAARQRLCDATQAAVSGDTVRDWAIATDEVAFFPYDSSRHLVAEHQLGTSIRRWYWPFKSELWSRTRFGGNTYRDDGIPWFAWHQVPVDTRSSSLSITYAFVSTHNHFVLDLGGKVFRQSAPLVKLPAGASEDDHVALLGLLNSSTSCFWLKQVSHNMGDSTDVRGARVTGEPYFDTYQFNATKLNLFPVPDDAPLGRARSIDRLARELAAVRPSVVCAAGIPTRESLKQAHVEYDRLRAEMIASQEELDWEVYRLYGLLDEDLTAPEGSVPELKLGERAFEIVLARKVAAGETETQWFARHGSTPITEIPAHWPEAYRQVVERRIRVIEERPDIALIERPECKRRWAAKPWADQEREALRDWLLDRLEAESLWREAGRARVLSVAQLADRVRADVDFRNVVALYVGRDDYDLTAELAKLVADEAVPFLAGYRYKPSGLAKRAQWERTWQLQRREDAGEKLDKPIPVPPKYVGADFAKTSYWRNRGKLDVPKERFVLYPKAGRDADRTPVLGWAGWNHLDQAQALATLYLERKNQDAWPVERLLPLLAGLVELEPWLHQWYADPAPAYPGGAASFYTTLIDMELAALGRGRADLAPEKLA